MFVKLTRSGSRSYVQLVESYRDESGKPRQRTIATVGRLDETGGAVQSLLSGLLRATGQPAASTGTMAPAAPGTPGTPSIRFDSSLAYGDVFALDRLWHELGFTLSLRRFCRNSAKRPSMAARPTPIRKPASRTGSLQTRLGL